MKKRNRTKKRGLKLKRFIPIYLLMLPGLLYLLINNYIPMAGLVIAFKKLNFSVGIFNSPWVGLENFEYLFKTKDAFIITRNTLLYNIAFIILNTLFAVVFAIIISELRSKKASKAYQTIILMPYLISIVICSYLVYAFLSADSGFVNNSIFAFFHIPAISWYMETKYWPFILIFVYVWKNAGYISIVYLAAIIGISPEYYEAAALDGATAMRRIRHITIPMIRPTIIMMVLLSVGKIFYADFGLFYQVPMNSGALYDVTNVIDTYVYRTFLVLGDSAKSSAAGLYQSIVGFICVLASNLIVRKIDKESALF